MALSAEHHPQGILDPSSDSPSLIGTAQKGKGVSPSSGSLCNHHHLFQNGSDEEEERSLTNEDNGAEDLLGKSKKGLPWQRMKWTDEMVRLLISVVACVEEDGAPESGDALGKRKHGSGAAGKWKTVSKMMLEKGCYVSPQQCEDKFNDLNKRYKRLNEILGRGTTCQVVENPALLDSMPHVPPKAKEDVRKILSSKHLFYREMCAYHNGQRLPHSHDLSSSQGGGCAQQHAASSRYPGEEDAGSEEEDYEEDGDVEERNAELFGRSSDSFQVEIDGQRDWIRKRTLQLQEERMKIQMKAFELEKRRFKWQRFCSKKDRELERMKLENDRMSLENQRMSLQVKQREAELEFNRPAEPIDSSGFGFIRE
ncbi:unnamed protein product [Spirodela intermedia]|uniref:Myb/SANT-like DNA-binding domain-containing protein n=1 Tax=Spirodela intermedia TaxID=51605 RepID=A0A7I8JN11_SPIIN|nr:unnamed protein product [Spirodela intermedia]CAA6670852.1 unnamed protein product [Spirodela intermedia]